MAMADVNEPAGPTPVTLVAGGGDDGTSLLQRALLKTGGKGIARKAPPVKAEGVSFPVPGNERGHFHFQFVIHLA